MSDNLQSHKSKTTKRREAFANGVPLEPRNRKELALFFRLRKTTVVTMLVSSAVIVTAVCVALCTFSVALHYAVKSDAMNATQFCGLLAFGLVTVCAFVATTTLLAAAFRATRALHAALNPPLLRATLSYNKPTEAAPKPRDEVIEHFWRPPSADNNQSPMQRFSGPAVAAASQENGTEIRKKEAALTENQHVPAGEAVELYVRSLRYCPTIWGY